MFQIVTSFRDIGRSNWEGPNLPSYLKRTTNEYFERFERLLKLDNPIVVFTEPDLLPRFDEYKKQKLNLKVIADYDYPVYPDILKDIKRIQNLPSFKESVKQPWNPEYWSSGYVMINFLKSWYVTRAIDLNLVEKDDLIFWVDFGYARKDDDVPAGLFDNSNFAKNKIHVFSNRGFPKKIDVHNIIENNEVYIQGCHIGASAKDWYWLDTQIFSNMKLLMDFNLVDDDQSLYLMTYIKNKNRFQTHLKLEDDYWFNLFTDYNVGE